MKKLGLFLICFICLIGCSNKEDDLSFNTISSEEAYKIMESKDVIILDVRTSSEFKSGHIKDALNIPLDSLEDLILEAVQDKDATILVYCQSGRRSEEASKILIDMGYKDVNNFGGINSWTYEIVTD
jgi:rhodanese-related sulfurtransferase